MIWGATLVVPQAIEWKTSVAHSATSLNYGILLQGIGGIIAVPLIDAYGRLPLWLWPQVLTLGVVIGCCFAQSWTTFTALRSLQGLFGTVPQVMGLPIIYDMYSPTEWPRMINIWGTTFLVGPFLGPAIAGYLLEAVPWRGDFGVLAGLYGLSTILILLCGRETYYDKDVNVQQTDKLMAFLGIGNTKLPKVSTITTRSINIVKLAFFTLPLLLVGISSMINFFWPIGITTTIDAFLHAPPYLMSNIAGASMRWAGVVGALIGYALGYIFNEWVYKSSKRQTLWRSEYRLHGVWLPILTMACGLLTYGLTLNHGKSWVGLAFGWAMVVAGMVASTV